MSRYGFIKGKLTQEAGLWDAVRVPSNMVDLLGISDPDLVQITDDGGGSTGVWGLGFGPVGEEEATFNLQMPNGYVIGTNIYPYVKWTTVEPSGGGVVWGLEYTVAPIDAPFFTTETLETTAASAVDIPGEYHIDSLGVIKDGNPFSIFGVSTSILCRLYRITGDLDDTLPVDAVLIGVDFFYQKDALGSTSIFSKD